MENKKGFAAGLESFFAGKGFYIVLFLCIAVIAVSAWTMLSGDIGSSDSMDMGSLAAGETDAPEDIPTFREEVVTTEPPVPAATAEPEPEAEPEQETAAPPEPVEEFVPTVSQDAETAPVYFIRPVAGSIENEWAMETLLYDRTMHDWRTHDGIDIAAELGAKVMAVADGRVEKVYSDTMYGTTVVISHGGGLKSVYSNLAQTPTVSEGESIAVGSVIGSVGDTALCETAEVTHLHFSMSLDGKSVDPESFLP